MPKKFIRRFLPDHQSIKQNKALKIFGTVLHEPNLWHLNRRSAAGAFGIGLFFAFWPVPFQMWLSAGIAIPCRVNLPLSIATVWITNPSWQWVVESINTIGPAFLVGCGICSVVFGLAGYFSLNWIWRLQVKKAWQRRKQLRLNRSTAK